MLLRRPCREQDGYLARSNITEPHLLHTAVIVMLALEIKPHFICLSASSSVWHLRGEGRNEENKNGKR